jgi:hypothetical protein
VSLRERRGRFLHSCPSSQLPTRPETTITEAPPPLYSAPTRQRHAATRGKTKLSSSDGLSQGMITAFKSILAATLNCFQFLYPRPSDLLDCLVRRDAVSLRRRSTSLSAASKLTTTVRTGGPCCLGLPRTPSAIPSPPPSSHEHISSLPSVLR